MHMSWTLAASSCKCMSAHPAVNFPVLHCAKRPSALHSRTKHVQCKCNYGQKLLGCCVCICVKIGISAINYKNCVCKSLSQTGSPKWPAMQMGLHVFFGCYHNLFRLMARSGVLENLLVKEHTHTFVNEGGQAFVWQHIVLYLWTESVRS